jgi:hypothetical protein
MIRERKKTVLGRAGRKVKLPVSQTAPVLTQISETEIGIHWAGIKPVDWMPQVLAAPGGEWEITTAIPGTAHSFPIPNTVYQVRVVGRDKLHNPVTEVSNVLTLNLPDKHIVLSYDPVEDELSWIFDGAAPAQWEIVNSTDGGLTYPNQEFVDGAAMNDAPEYDSGQWKIRQVNSDNSPASAWSNVAVKS